ncbi:Integrase catalytic domain-containing protein, partial [Trichostrongylus colubriformis]
MSTLRGHQSKITTALTTLIKTISTVDPAYTHPLDTTSPPEIQLRMILRRRGVISAAKFAIERALEILKERYEAIQLFVQTQDNRALVSEEVDQFWIEQQGDKYQQEAQDTIIALDTQLTLDEAIETSLRTLLNNNIANASGSLLLADSPTRNIMTVHRSTDHTNNMEQQYQHQLSFTPPAQSSPLLSPQPIQLRRLELPTFDGDLAQYHDFWCRFKTAVHDNEHLPLSTKFIYLANALKGSAALIIQGFDPSKPDNYHLAIQALKKRYDRPHFTHNLFHHKLEQLPTSSVLASSQRDTLSQVQSYILQLNRFEDTRTSLSLMKLIRKKFPRETQLEVNKLEHRSGKTWTLPELLDGLNEIIEELEKLEDYTIDKSLLPEISVNPVSAPSLRPSSRSSTPEPSYNIDTCCFCGSYNHRSIRCHHRMSTNSRRIIAKTLNLCWKCLRTGHASSNCGYPRCHLCAGQHHPILCTRQSTHSPYRRTGRSRHRHRHRSPSSSSSRSSYRHSRTSSYDSSRYSSRSPIRRRSDDNASPPSRTNHRTARSTSADSRVRGRPSVRFQSPVRSQSPAQNTISSNHSSTAKALHNSRGHETSVHSVAESEEGTELVDNFEHIQLSATVDSSRDCTLMTAQALLYDPKSRKCEPVVLLLDTGSQSSFITHSTVDRFHLTVHDTAPLTTVAFGAIRSTEQSGKTYVTLIDQQRLSLPLQLNTKEQITVPCNPVRLTQQDKQALRSLGIPLESLTAVRCVMPEILIGINYFWDIVLSKQPTTLPSGLVQQKLITANTTAIQDETDPISRFDTLDIIGIADNPDPLFDQEEDARILQRFQDTAFEVDGYLYVQFPWRLNHPRLADNKLLARKRLESQYRSLNSKPHLWKLYADTIADYVRQGIVEQVQEHHSDDPRVYYIPHQAVVKESSTTTKLRVVFDASSHYKGAPSLNDCLHPGPSILPDLVGILLRSRLPQYLLISDVEKAFLQIRLQLDQRDATRFLWLRDHTKPPTDDNIEIFRFTRVPFGITASPFLLAASILYYLRRDPNGTLNNEIEQNTYVDNIVLGASSELEAIRKYQESKALFVSMHMNLRQFLCNSSAVNNAIAPVDRMQSSAHTSLLGIRWNPHLDHLIIPFNTTMHKVTSKRTALKALASTFDPLGLLSPFLAPFKIFQQDLWSKSYQWDDPLDQLDISRWNQLVQDIQHPLPSIPRCIIPTGTNSFELVVFGDASKRLYASCVYLLCRSSTSTSVHLVMAKSLLGPRKPITMPRMELLATLISLRLVRFVHSQLHWNISAVHIFSDSQIVLHWIHSTRPLRIFVNNRIMEIRSILAHFKSLGISTGLYYVQSECNPADCASRGIPTALAHQEHIWWSGPSFLRLSPTEWPQVNNFALPPEVDQQVQQEYQALLSSSSSSYVSPIRFKAVSRYNTLIRSTVYVLKIIRIIFAHIHRIPTSFDAGHFTSSMHISALEFETAEALLIKEHYRENEILLAQLPLDRFNAHRATSGLIHCPHRLQQASNGPSLPILLVPPHPLVSLIVLHIHHSQYHSGVHSTIATLRLNYYIPSIRRTVAKILRQCIVCKKTNALPYRYPDIPSLPKERVTRSRPFQNIGLDYLGPLRYKDSFNVSAKIWICLITCMATRAVHLELVLNNTTQEFLLAFRRFISRRGVPSLVLSDNAATFRSANDTLQKAIYAQSSFQQVSRYFTSRHIRWKFITPLSPWKGGFYERLVGLVKTHIRKSIGHSLIPFQQFHTIIVEIEGILNSRPLTSIADTTNSPTVLRPVDFLVPEVQLQLPSSLSDSITFDHSQHRLVEWYQEVGSVLDKFWTMWSTDYLSAISERQSKRNHKAKSTPSIPQTHCHSHTLTIVMSTRSDNPNVSTSTLLSTTTSHRPSVTVSPDTTDIPSRVDTNIETIAHSFSSLSLEERNLVIQAIRELRGTTPIPPIRPPLAYRPLFLPRLVDVADLDYPPTRRYPLTLVAHSFKGLIEATTKLTRFNADLAKDPSKFESVPHLLNLYEELATLIYNVQARRNTLMDLIAPRILNPIEDNRQFTDFLNHYGVNISRLKHILVAATAATSHAFSLILHLTTAIRYNLDIPAPLPADPNATPSLRQLLGQITRNHNIDTVLQHIRELSVNTVTTTSTTSTAAPATAAPPTTANRKSPRSTSTSQGTVVASKPLEPPASQVPASRTPDRARQRYRSSDSQESRQSRISRRRSRSHSPSELPLRRTFPSRRRQGPLSRRSRSPTPDTLRPPERRARASTDQVQCFFCQGPHYTASCEEVTSLAT